MTVSALSGESFVSLTTYRRSGEGVATPVWPRRRSGSRGHTVDGSGKVKRLRNDARVTLRPCNRSSKVEPDALTVEGTAEVITDASRIHALTDPIRRKYGLQFKVVMGIEKVVGRGRTRVALRISDPE